LIDRYITECGNKAVLIKEVARTFIRDHNISQADLANESLFWDLQVGIVKEQLRRENELDGQDFISDRSVIDALVYAALRKPETFPSLMSDDDWHKSDAAERLLIPLIGCSKETLDDVSCMVRRYKRSLVILVHPFKYSIVDDGTRLLMNEDELIDYSKLCCRILRMLGVPFVELRETELPKRVEILKRILQNFRPPSPLFRVEHFERAVARNAHEVALSRECMIDTRLEVDRSARCLTTRTSALERKEET
jgi:hypothetical protein